MLRTAWALLAGVLLVLPATSRAADDSLAGNWKVTLLEGGERKSFWLIKLEATDGKWTGTLLATEEGVAKTTLVDVGVTPDRLRFTLRMETGDLTFEGKLPAEGGKAIRGSVAQERTMAPTMLEATTLKSFDKLEKSKDVLASQPNSPDLFRAALTLISQASEQKSKPEEVRGWADKAFKAAEAYGPRWQREVAVRIADELSDQEGYATVAVEYARRGERLLDPKADPTAQVRVLEVLAAALKKAGKADDAKEIDARVAKLEPLIDQEYLRKMPPFKPEVFAGRKEKSDRAVLVELFTGAQCPPCVGADLAFDGLLKTYKPTDVVLLQYHMHFNGPDPLSGPDSEARETYYDKEIEGGPTILFNGKTPGSEGGSASESFDLYSGYRKLIEPILERPSRARLKASAVRKGNQIDIMAEASDVDKPGEKIRLRLALVEEQIRYIGGNRVRFHHHVVRALPGGAEGLALTEKSGKQSVRVDLGDLRKKINAYLDTVAKERPFPTTVRPMDFKNLSVVAFVQDDRNKDILQAIQVEVREAAGE